MNCVTFSDNLLPDLTKLVNAQLAGIPPGWALAESQTAQIVNKPTDLWNVHYPEQDTVFEFETLCVLDQARLVAAAQWGYVVQPEPHPTDQSSVLLWIVAEPDNLDGVQLLLAQLLEHSQAAGNNKITTTRYGFGVGWLGIPAHWSNIIQALQAAGFAVSDRWVLLTRSVNLPEVSKPDSAAAMQVTWQENTDAAETELRLHTDGTLAGECQAWGIPRYFSACEGYGDWVMVEWLGVEPVYQRKGIGRWLIAEQFRKQAQRGARHVIMWTETDNQALLGLGESLGFKIGPECWEFSKG